jgi:2'-5' RNA ligase
VDKVRSFIAVPAGEEIERTVRTVEGELGLSGADVKWVRPGNVHITLKFLGGVEAERLGRVPEALRRSLKGVRSFQGLVSGVGTFPPNVQRARVVWLGLVQGVEEMKSLAGAVEDAMEPLGFDRESRGFRCHITIGRVKRGARRLDDLARCIAGVEFKPLKLLVDRVNLVKSELTPAGAVYTVLETFGLER